MQRCKSHEWYLTPSHTLVLQTDGGRREPEGTRDKAQVILDAQPGGGGNPRRFPPGGGGTAQVILHAFPDLPPIVTT